MTPAIADAGDRPPDRSSASVRTGEGPVATGRRSRARTTPQNVAGGDRRGCASSASVDEAIADGLATYPGLPHRMERVAEKHGVLFVNDSKATNPTSTAPALAAYPARPLDPRRPAQDRRSRRLRAAARPCPRRLHDRRGRADVRASCCGRRCRSSECGLLDQRRPRAAAARGARARWSCCRRPAPRSTSSGTMKRAATPSAPRWRPWHERWCRVRSARARARTRLGRSDRSARRAAGSGRSTASCSSSSRC